MLSKSECAVVRFQNCRTRQICIFFTSPSSESQQKDNTAIVKALSYLFLSGVKITQINRVQVTFSWSSLVLFKLAYSVGVGVQNMQETN